MNECTLNALAFLFRFSAFCQNFRNVKIRGKVLRREMSDNFIKYLKNRSIYLGCRYGTHVRTRIDTLHQCVCNVFSQNGWTLKPQQIKTNKTNKQQEHQGVNDIFSHFICLNIFCLIRIIYILNSKNLNLKNFSLPQTEIQPGIPRSGE